MGLDSSVVTKACLLHLKVVVSYVRISRPLLGTNFLPRSTILNNARQEPRDTVWLPIREEWEGSISSRKDLGIFLLQRRDAHSKSGVDTFRATSTTCQTNRTADRDKTDTYQGLSETDKNLKGPFPSSRGCDVCQGLLELGGGNFAKVQHTQQTEKRPSQT